MNPLQATPRTIFSLARTWANVTRAPASANAESATPDLLATSGTAIEMKTVRILVCFCAFISIHVYICGLFLSPYVDISCSGIGTCVNTAALFTMFGLSYGNVTTDYIKPGGNNWDAYRWHHCICPASVGAGLFSDQYRPAVGPK